MRLARNLEPGCAADGSLGVPREKGREQETGGGDQARAGAHRIHRGPDASSRGIGRRASLLVREPDLALGLAQRPCTALARAMFSWRNRGAAEGDSAARQPRRHRASAGGGGRTRRSTRARTARRRGPLRPRAAPRICPTTTSSGSRTSASATSCWCRRGTSPGRARPAVR